MFEDNPIFNKPKNKNIKIWRYMDFTKYLSMIDTKSLYFARADKLGDPFEGSWTLKDFNTRDLSIKEIAEKNNFDPNPSNKAVIEISRALVKHTAISCWHKSNNESYAMWKLYGKDNRGIAIQSTYNKLKNSFTDSRPIGISEVEYIDYKRGSMKKASFYSPYICKRESFKYENEIRAIYIELKHLGVDADLFNFTIGEGLNIEVNLGKLVENIYLAPQSPKWFHDLVISVNDRYGFNFNVIQSSLDEDPMF